MNRTVTLLGAKTSTLFVLLIWCCSLFTPAVTTAAEITVSASLSPSSISVNQSGQLSLTVNGTKSAELEIPDVEGLEILRQGQSSRVNIVNGSYSSSITTAYAIIPSTPGRYTIPPIKVRAGKKHLETEPLELTVTNSSAAAAAGSGAAQPPADSEEARGFMTLENLSGEHYLGEVVPITIKAYFHQGLRADLASLPSLIGDSCVIETLKKNPVQVRETVNGTSYNVLIWETSLSPIKEGNHFLQLEMDAVQYLQQRRQSTSLFGGQSPFGRDLFDDFFGGVQKRPFTLTSEPVPLTILSLPAEGRPESFNGAIGRFSFETAVIPDRAEVGEPLTLQLQIKGAGNLDRVEAPRFPDAPGWKSYTASALDVDPSRQQDEKIFEQAIVAKNTGVQSVPSITFSYFDPDKKSYVTLTSQPLPVSITGEDEPLRPAPSAASAASTTAANKPDRFEGVEGLAPLHLEPGKQVQAIRPLFLHNWFLLLIGVIVFLLTGAAAVRVHQHRSDNRQETRHHVRMKKFRRSLQIMETAAGNDDSSDFLKEARHCIQQHFGSLWGCEPSAITLTDIRTRSRKSEQLAHLFEMSEQAAYGGRLLDKQAMTEALHLLRAELEEMA